MLEYELDNKCYRGVRTLFKERLVDKSRRKTPTVRLEGGEYIE